MAKFRAKTADLQSELTSLQQKLAASEERFRLLADAAPIMIWMADAEGLCTFFNRAWLEFRGRTLEQEVGNQWVEGVHPEDRTQCLETFLKCLSTRKIFRLQFRLQRDRGKYRWVEGTGTPRYEGLGEFAGFVGTAVDIDDRKNNIFNPDEATVRKVMALTEREREVLILIAGGKSTKSAAEELGISYKTCDSHRSRILEKLGIHNTAGMVRHAIRSGLIEP
ncbi:MAG TPA: PAS domain S-box protein [Bryobacteraceae bacterium]|nr:PAS domain S-box protein [Bryobacteraceae bacterium]